MKLCGSLIVSVIIIGIAVNVQPSTATVCFSDLLYAAIEPLIDLFDFFFGNFIAFALSPSLGNCSFNPTNYTLYNYDYLVPNFALSFFSLNSCTNVTCSLLAPPNFGLLIALNTISCRLCNYAQFISVFISKTCNTVQPFSCPPGEPVESVVFLRCRKFGDNTIYNVTKPSEFVQVLGPGGSNDNTNVSFVVHGWQDSCDNQWETYLTKALTRNGNSVSCCLEWKFWARRSYCDNVRQNIYIVGDYLGRILKNLTAPPYSVPVSKLILLGHSFGAHIIGFAGKQFVTEKIPYCIAMDPAGQQLSNPILLPSERRLAPTDCGCVKAIYTDAYGLGSPRLFANYNVIANRGSCQPHCRTQLFPCDHYAAVAYFIEAILNATLYPIFRAGDNFTDYLGIYGNTCTGNFSMTTSKCFPYGPENRTQNDNPSAQFDESLRDHSTFTYEFCPLV